MSYRDGGTVTMPLHHSPPSLLSSSSPSSSSSSSPPSGWMVAEGDSKEGTPSSIALAISCCKFKSSSSSSPSFPSRSERRALFFTSSAEDTSTAREGESSAPVLVSGRSKVATVDSIAVSMTGPSFADDDVPSCSSPSSTSSSTRTAASGGGGRALFLTGLDFRSTPAREGPVLAWPLLGSAAWRCFRLAGAPLARRGGLLLLEPVVFFLPPLTRCCCCCCCFFFFEAGDFIRFASTTTKSCCAFFLLIFARPNRGLTCSGWMGSSYFQREHSKVLIVSMYSARHALISIGTPVSGLIDFAYISRCESSPLRDKSLFWNLSPDKIAFFVILLTDTVREE
mmetsp:Transcript_7480/g.11821  ORF Transcript_7480/g.11821 Transcript_7480/m.11821 type:complete len:339 (-) Transcript_7480:981-1997(-)